MKDEQSLETICFENDFLRKEVHKAKVTLRDQFAMAALQGIIVTDREYSGKSAEYAYHIADAMMEARK
jgi:hypothetical protein